MNKQSVVLPGQQGAWGSYISKYQPDSSKVLDNMFTAGSKNFVTDQTGMIQKRQGGIQWNRTSFPEAAKDTYEAVFESGARHFLRVGGGTLSASTGTGLFDTITSGYSSFGNFEWVTYQDRSYGCNGINSPQTYDIATSYGGVSYSFTTAKTKAMGAQAPTSAPTVGVPSSGGAVPIGPHKYKITYMYYGAEESNGSTASSVQTTTSGNQTIALTAIPIGGYGVTARNIYRDNNDDNFLLLDTISNNTTTTYTDVLSIGATPTPIPTFNDLPPTFSKCALWLDSIFIAPTGETNVVRYSNAGSPNIFDPDNFITCQSDDVVTALYVYNGKLYVFGLHSFGSIEGNTPDTFYYHNISNLIGCVDNRSIQVRSIVSVPTLWWLSDKGLYYSNGNTVEYGSDFIQDLVNLNIAQVNYSTNKNTQTSYDDFSGDTYTPGIDIETNPGAITTQNPTKEYSSSSDWNGGSSVTNCKTTNGNFLEVPTRFAPTLASGTLGGSAIISGSNVTLPSSSNFTGESSSGSQNPGRLNIPASVWRVTALGVRIVPPRDGTITNMNIPVSISWPGGAATIVVYNSIYTDSFGQPGARLYNNSTTYNVSGSALINHGSVSMNYALTGGQAYWLVVEECDTGASTYNCIFSIQKMQVVSAGAWTGNSNSYARFVYHGTPGAPFGPCVGDPYPYSSWQQVEHSLTNGAIGAAGGSYTFAITPVAPTGFWGSPIYDSGSTTSLPNTIQMTGTYPSGTACTTTIYASANSNMTGPVTQVISNPNGTYSVTLSGYRYWQIVHSLSTSNNLNVPTVSAPVMLFQINATWISQPIDTTTDNTTWNSLSYTGNVPLGTSVVLTIATSSNNITYSSYGPIGSAVVARWAKVKAVLTSTSDNVTSPSVASITLNWTISATITSSIIDSGTIPAGFNTAQWEQVNLSIGTVTFYVRTAASAGGIPAASWVQVANGEFPDLSALRYMQWKAILGSTANTAPTITSVTLSWFMSVGTVGVRCASIFYNKTYYLAVATIGSTVNDTLIQLDQFGNWRIQKDASVGTFLSYFNVLYFTDGVIGNIYNGFIADTDNGTAIAMDVRTKAWNADNDLFLKVPRAFKVTGIHTGTNIHAYYSSDRGVTWIEMLNENGTLGYQTSTSGMPFTILFVPDGLTLNSGRTLMYRLTSSDIYPCSIMNYVPSFYSRQGRYLHNG
jgi:hypothetical protein